MQELKRWNAVRSNNQRSVCIPRHTWWTVGELGFGGARNEIAAALGMEPSGLRVPHWTRDPPGDHTER